jgi:hypothetical protein
MADNVKQQFLDGIQSLTQSVGDLAQARQNIVVRALILRDAGFVADQAGVAEYERARITTLTAAQSFDKAVAALPMEARTAVQKAFNDAVAKYPEVKLSSPEFAEIIELAVPPIPSALFVAKDSEAIQQVVAVEQALYPKTGPSGAVSGLGFAFLGPLISGCGTAIAATAAATAGIGGVVVAIGCVAAAVYLAVKAYDLVTAGIDAVVDLFAQDVAVSRNETERVKALTENLTKLDELTKGMTPDQKAKVIEQYTQQGLKQPKADAGLPWGLIATVAAGVGLYLFWPTLVGKARSFRASQPAVAGLRRRRRR